MAFAEALDPGQTQVIVLNGMSSVGKSSVAKAVQRIAQKPFLHVQIDDFLTMLPPRAIEHEDGLVFHRIDSKNIDVQFGPIVTRALEGMRYAIAAMAERGNHMIVDDVFFDSEDTEYRQLLRQFDLRLIGLFAPLDVVRNRELARGDREIGLAQGQFERVHNGRTYDLEVDTSQAPPDAIARKSVKPLAFESATGLFGSADLGTLS
jgi:chloramphenicol 3-O phosphotransferase